MSCKELTPRSPLTTPFRSACRTERFEPGLQIVAVDHAPWTDYFITASAAPGETPAALFAKAAGCVCSRGAAVVSLEVFGLSLARDGAALEAAFPCPAFPVTWMEANEAAPPPAGLQIWAVRGVETSPLSVDGRVIGTVFTQGAARICRLGNLLPDDPAASPAEQSRAVFDRMIQGLRLAGMDFSRVVRTWFYNLRMLEWYDDFNRVRTDFFREHGVFDGLVPASTAVGGRNGAGTALTAGLLAVDAQPGGPAAFAVPSPLQCPALEYGSAFSRAAELQFPGYRRLLVSGTASIAPAGESLHVDDVDAQIDLTMRVVEGILLSRGMGWGDVSRGLAYFKYAGDVSALDRYIARAGLPALPVLSAGLEICRDDLLFEIELDALKASGDDAPGYRLSQD